AKVHGRDSSAGFAGAIDPWGEASEGAAEGPAEEDTPAALKVAISLQTSAAARARWMKSAAPVPSPRRRPRSRYGSSPRCSSARAWPRSAERCDAKSAGRDAGARGTATSAAAPAVDPSNPTRTPPP